MLLPNTISIINFMGRVVKIIKTMYGKIDWDIVKTILKKFLDKKFIIKENSAEIRIDKKFIKEYIHSNYTYSAKKKTKKVKANIVISLDQLIIYSGHIREEKNTKAKHNNDASFGFEKYKVKFSLIDCNDNVEEYDCTLVIRCPNFKEKYLYDIVDIKKASPSQ